MPRPVTANARAPAAVGGRSIIVPFRHADLAEHEVDRVADGGDALELVLGHLDVEVLLEAHHELDEVEAVGLEVFFEAGPAP